jgi:hypothetical protein
VFISSTFPGGTGLQLDCRPDTAPSDGLSFTDALARPFESVPIEVGAPVAPAPAVKSALTVRSSALRASGRKVAVALACAGAPCKGTLSVRTASKVGGRIVTVTRPASYSLAAGRRATVKLTLSAQGRKLLRARNLKVRLTVAPAGGTASSKRLVLRGGAR